jgi:hypothetical protein
MKNYDSNVYLYAKYHYQRSNDIMQDLRKIYAIRNGINVEHMQNRDIILCLLHLTFKHMNNEHKFLSFISDINPNNTWKVGYRYDGKYDFYYAVASKCLSILSTTLVSDIENGLDEPDPNVLPLNKF